jgi:hypothetical protein
VILEFIMMRVARREVTAISFFVLLPALGSVACSDSVDSSGYVVMGAWSPEPGTQVWASAAFSRGLLHESSAAIAKEAGCALRVRPVPSGAAVDPATGTPGVAPPPEYLDAGQVTITANQTITLTRGSDGVYTGDPTTNSPMFHGGQTVTVEIAGNDDDPPGVSLTYAAPGQLDVTSPTGSAFTFDRTQNATFTWTPTYGDSVYLYMYTSSYTGEISCEWPMADGQAVIASSLLSGLSPGTAFASLHAQAMRTLDRGRWRITAGAYSYGIPADVTLW